MDFLAIASWGFYPTVLGTDTTERAALVATYGLFVGPLSGVAAEVFKGMTKLGLSLRVD